MAMSYPIPYLNTDLPSAAEPPPCLAAACWAACWFPPPTLDAPDAIVAPIEPDEGVEAPVLPLDSAVLLPVYK